MLLGIALKWQFQNWLIQLISEWIFDPDKSIFDPIFEWGLLIHCPFSQFLPWTSETNSGWFVSQIRPCSTYLACYTSLQHIWDASWPDRSGTTFLWSEEKICILGTSPMCFLYHYESSHIPSVITLACP